MASQARIFLPAECRIGDVIEIRTVFTHVMETGRRVDQATGAVVPRRIINRFVASFAGEDVFVAEIEPGIAANPAFSFHFRVPSKGPLTLTWVEDGGSLIVETVELPIVG